MSERQKQADFLKTLLACEDRPEHRDFGERVQMAERDEWCMKRACRLVGVITLMALAALGYLTVLKPPDEVAGLAQVALQFCQALALGSAMCLGVFIGLLFWHRALVNRLFVEGRKIITSEIKPAPHHAPSYFPKVIVHEGDASLSQIRTEARTAPGAEIITLPKAS
jgi:hypothetical protein